MRRDGDNFLVKDSVTYFFQEYDLETVFNQEDLDYDPQTIIRREILPSGKSRAFVNDTPVNLDSLTNLSSYILDIHSQHQTLQLTNDSFQFKVIDALANNADVLKDYSVQLKKHKLLYFFVSLRYLLKSI